MKIEQLSQNNQNTSPEKDIRKAAKEFESFFVSYLLKVMRESAPKSDLFSPGVGGDIYTSMLDEKFADGIASQGGLGLSRLLEKQINMYSSNADNMGSHKKGSKK